MRFKRILNIKIICARVISTIFIQAVVMLCVFGFGNAAGAAGNNIVASGDGFELTQKELDAYRDLLNSTNAMLPQKEIVRLALKYELLSREYQKEEKEPRASDVSGEEMSAAKAKIRNGNIYIQKILQDYVVPDAVVESYYRSHPQKYSSGKASDGKYILIPFDDNIKNDIIFTIVEANKEAIAQRFVDGLISKYNIKIQNGL